MIHANDRSTNHGKFSGKLRLIVYLYTQKMMRSWVPFSSLELHPTASHLRGCPLHTSRAPTHCNWHSRPFSWKRNSVTTICCNGKSKFLMVFFFDFTFHRSQQKQLERQVRSQPYPATIEIDLTFIGDLWCRVSSWPSSNIRATAPSKKLLALEAVIAVPRFPSIFEKASKPGAWNQSIL